MERANDYVGAAFCEGQQLVVLDRPETCPRSRRQICLLALCASLLPAGTSAQVAMPARLVGKIEERQFEVRPDSGGQLIGLIQHTRDASQDIAHLSGLLPARKAPMEVCLKARNRGGTYFADGKLSASPGEEVLLPVEAPGFPKVATAKAFREVQPEDLAVMFVSPPCDSRKSRAYPAASLGPAGNLLTATLNLGKLQADPEARLTPEGKTRPEIAGSCRRLGGRSLSFNVLCEFSLAADLTGGNRTMSVDYTPMRGPGDTAIFRIWIAPSRP